MAPIKAADESPTKTKVEEAWNFWWKSDTRRAGWGNRSLAWHGRFGRQYNSQQRLRLLAWQASVTDALTLLAGGGQWELLAAKGPAAVDAALKSPAPNPSALSRWALELPAREETAETFRHAVAASFRDDLAGSVTWAGSLPAGWHREQALAQLAITADTFHQDAATREAVMGEITDPAVLAEVRE